LPRCGNRDFEAHPLTDIRNALKVRAVVANGRYLDQQALDALLAAARVP
jgi:hypothetical protein